MPEMAVSTVSALGGKASIALGNVIGSNIFNILMILGLASLIAPLPVSIQLIRLDVPLMIGASLLTWLFALNGVIGRAEGAVLFAGIIAYTVLLIVQSRREDPAVKAEFEHKYSEKEPLCAGALLKDGALVLLGLALLVLGSKWLVDGAVTVAQMLGVSELVIGLTIVAAGTSLPELATSVVAGIRGERDIAVGNVIGSCLFNLLAVAGLSALVSPDGMAVSPKALHVDFPVMILTAVICLPIFITGKRISRLEGALLFGGYIAYMVCVICTA
jgi:cation:H+ antiporter